jgi:hypothetical protein
MERITRHEFERRLILLCVRSGMRGLPRTRRDREILLKSIALLLTSDRVYTEAEIGTTIRLWLGAVAVRLQTDHATLRRHLVEQGYLVRDPWGSEYRLHEPTTTGIAFESDVDFVNVLSLVIAATEQMQRRRRDRFPRPGEDSGRCLLQARDICKNLVAGSIDPQVACDQLADLYDHRFVFLLDLRGFQLRRSGAVARDRIVKLDEATGFTLTFRAQRFLNGSEEWIQALGNERDRG